MYIIIGADLVPTESNFDLFISGNDSLLFGNDIIEILQHAEFRIFNLEVPLTDDLSPIDKYGPNLHAPTETVNGYKKINVDLVTLANNHIMDQGERGLISTVDTLQTAGINYVGAANNLNNSVMPYVFSFANKKIGIYACAEHEFSIAGDNKPGANPFDPLWSLDHIEKLKKEADYVVVLYHGGKEHYRYPSPLLQKTCRRMIDKGADLVICQHSHCIGCEEKYRKGTIVYGQGNFLFDDSNNECWQTSLLIRVEEDMGISYIPIEKKDNCVRMSTLEKRDEILTGFKERSKKIETPGFIEENYNEFAKDFQYRYFDGLAGKQTIISRILNKISRNKYRRVYLKKAYGKMNRLRLLNYLECEAHREMLSSCLKHYCDF